MPRKGTRICGTSSNGVKYSGRVMTPSQALKYRERGQEDLADHMLTMDDAQRQKFDHLRELEANDDWQDEPYNAMDVDSILEGTAVVDLSHEGGEFYELVEHCVEATSKQA